MLGDLLGSAARIFKAVAMADKQFTQKYLIACTSYSDQSFGAGFINNILHWFPELSPVKQRMEDTVAISLKAAQTTYETCITQLRAVCSCKACQTSSNGFTVDETDDEEMTPAPDSDESAQSSHGSSDEDWDPERYCLVIVAETVIVLSRALANVSLDNPKLLPTRKGFELAYGRQLNMRRSALSGKQAIKDLGQIAFCMDFDGNFSFGMREHDDGVEIRLHTIVELFAGEHALSSSTGISALCKKGICVYLGVLRDASMSRDGVGRIHVIPGRIQHEKKSYERLEDRYIIQDDEYAATVMNIVSNEQEWSEPKLSIKESSTTLECLLYLRGKKDASSNEATAIAGGPANLADLLSARRGLVRCRNISGGNKPCEKVKELKQIERQRLLAESNSLHMFGHHIHFLRCKSSAIARTVAAHSAGQYILRSGIFVADMACPDCCLKTLAKYAKPDDVDLFVLYLE